MNAVETEAVGEMVCTVALAAVETECLQVAAGEYMNN